MSILVDYLISEIRSNTDNEEFNDTVGFSDEEMVRFINDGKNNLHAKIVAQHSTAFVEEIIVSATNDLEYYSLPYDAFLGNKLTNIEFSYTGLDADYYSLKKVAHKLRTPNSKGSPQYYSLKANKIYLSPIPQNSSGTIRISYVQAPKQVNKRRGQIISTTQCSDSLTAPTFININYLDASNDPNELARDTYFCVVDKYGNIKMSNIILSSIGAAGTTVDLTTYDAQLVIDSATVFNTGDVLAQEYYIVPGKFATSHIDDPDNVRRYIRVFAETEILMRDSSVSVKESTQLLLQFEKNIVDSYADTSDDVDYIPEINTDWNY
jgi:hypothetical protein